jgi:hypothetical protein
MSTSNIIAVEPVIEGDIPMGVKVTFQTRRGTRTYFYDVMSIGLGAVTNVMEGNSISFDPQGYPGTLVESNE